MAEKTQPQFRLMIKQDKCDGCASREAPICTEICPHSAVYPDVNTNYIWVDCELSGGHEICRKCADACPQEAIEIQKVPGPEIKERSITYFKTPGIQNTKRVVDVIGNRAAAGDVKTVVVASCSGSSAFVLAKALQSQPISIVNISAPKKACERIGWRPISNKMVQRLTELGVICREKYCVDVKKFTSFPTESFFYDRTSSRRYKIKHLEKVLYETLVHVGGMGLKTAVECVFSACLHGDVTVGGNVIGTAGSGWGLDTAAVIRATTPEKCFGKKPSERLEIREILAMPIKKQRWG